MSKFSALLLATLFAVPAAAQDRTVKFLVGFPAGATLDSMTRLIAERMRSTLNQPVVVENRPGAGGQIAGFMGVVSDLSVQHKAGRVRVLATSGAQRARIQKSDHDKWGPVIKASGFKPES